MGAALVAACGREALQCRSLEFAAPAGDWPVNNLGEREGGGGGGAPPTPGDTGFAWGAKGQPGVSGKVPCWTERSGRRDLSLAPSPRVFRARHPHPGGGKRSGNHTTSGPLSVEDTSENLPFPSSHSGGKPRAFEAWRQEGSCREVTITSLGWKPSATCPWWAHVPTYVAEGGGRKKQQPLLR